MSARVCQLCGKPLSRIRVGTEGDFCSREHRNQFRLRQGMDRLMEANKVANLMRRRELTKALVVAQADSAASLERRVFAETADMPVRTGVITRQLRVTPSGSGAAGLGECKRTEVALVRFHVLETEQSRRSLPLIGRKKLGLFLPARNQSLRGSRRSAAPSIPLALKEVEGDLLRVSRSAGFHLRKMELPSVDARLSTHAIRGGLKKAVNQLKNRLLPARSFSEQWSAIRSRLYVPEPQFLYHGPWKGLGAGPMELPGPRVAGGAPPSATRLAQVKIELQETMHYAISSEEDRG
jgi:hypothetical protein